MNTLPDELWTIREIATFGKWAPTYVANTIVNLPGFPEPLRVTGPGAKPRWISNAVRAWAANLASLPSPPQTGRSSA